MKTDEIRKRVRAFCKEYRIKEISAESLEDVFRKQGFTIIEFNPVINDNDVTTVINSLKIEEMILHTNGFLYVDANYRLVFLNEKLTEEEKKILLAHEAGHYCCGHLNAPNVIGRSVQEEYEANEFAHYLLRRNNGLLLKRALFKNRKRITIGLIIIGLVVGGCIAEKDYHDRQLYEGEYYVTVHGEKYHRPSCVTIQGHTVRRLTKEDVETGKYTPCNVCHPEE